MPTSIASLDVTQYVRINTAYNPLTLQSHRDAVRIAISTLKPAVENTAFHLLDGGDPPLQFDSIDTNVWALAQSETSSLVVTETEVPKVDPQLSQTAFGELSTAELTPIVQLQFPYYVNPEIVRDHSNNGTLTVDNSRVKLSTGAGANRSAVLLSRVPIKYNPGQGGLGRFTSMYTEGVAGSIQIHGVGDVGDGYFFGYNGADFGVLRRFGGNPEIQSLEITTGSTTDEDITITLDGNANTVTVTNSGDATTTANEIVEDTGWADLGTGWTVHAEGKYIIFTSFDAAVHNGVYSITATTAAGTYSQQLAAVLPTEVWIAQTAWNEDVCDGTDEFPLMDWTKGNVFQVRYQWLGYGQICFCVENPNTGDFESVHRIKYANENLLPSVQNPTLPLCASVINTTNATDVILYSSSMGGFIEGKQGPAPTRHGKKQTLNLTTTTAVPILTLHNQHLFKGKVNRARIKLTFISITNESGKPAVFSFIIDGRLTGAVFAPLEVNSLMDTDTTATVLENGDFQFAISLTSGNSEVIDLTSLNFFIDPLSKFTIAGAQTTGGTASVVTVAVNWEENF